MTNATDLAAYAVEQNYQAAIASGEPESVAQSTWTTLQQTTEIMERYRVALEEIERRSGGDMGRIASHALAGKRA